jgi:prepilin-type N-terminal cleavage/methylation domain-containing protein
VRTIRGSAEIGKRGNALDTLRIAIPRFRDSAIPDGGFTIVELLMALALGALVMLVLFRAFAGAVAAQAETEAQIAGHQQSRDLAQWIAGIIQASSAVRTGTASLLELSGSFEAGAPVECVGIFPGRLAPLRGTVVYEQRRANCPDGATSTGGVAALASDPTVSTTVAFGYRDARGRPVADVNEMRLIDFTVTVDVDRDGRADYRLTQVAALRGDHR